MMEKKRSIGVTIFGWFFILSSLAGISQSGLVLLNIEGMPAINLLFLLVELAFNIACLLIGAGVLSLSNTWRKAAIYYALFLFILSIIELSILSLGDAIVQIIVKIIGLVIISIFFTRPKVKEQFK